MRIALIATFAGLAAAACQSTPDPAEAERRAAELRAVEERIAAYQGDELNRVCFARGINGWRPLGPGSILVNRGIDDWYKLELGGFCRSRELDAIAFNTGRGRSCIARGHRVATSDFARVSSCMVSAIHAWSEPMDEAAPIEPSTAGEG